MTKKRMWQVHHGSTLLTLREEDMIEFGYTEEQLDEIEEAQTIGPQQPLFHGIDFTIKPSGPLKREDLDDFRKMLGLEDQNEQGE